MSRMIPLLKMAARMVFAGIALTAAYRVAMSATLGSSGGVSLGYLLADVVVTGTLAGLFLAIPMTLATLVFFREIKRPHFYRFAMVTVSLIFVAMNWGPVADYYREALMSPWRGGWRLVLFVNTFLYYTLLVFACSIAAQAYTREFQERKLARQEFEAKLDRTKR